MDRYQRHLELQMERPTDEDLNSYADQLADEAERRWEQEGDR